MSEYLEMTIKDSGIGIPPESQEKIFDRFSSVTSSPTRNFEGVGIGLALCRELVKLHGGKITVESKPGQGSSFTISLPRKGVVRSTGKAGSDPVQLQSSEKEWIAKMNREALTTGTDLMLPRNIFGAQTSLEKNFSGKKTVLIVEDNPDLLSFLSSELQREYRLILSRDGEEALGKIEKERPDLVISDIMMPKMNGYEFCRRMKNLKSHRDIPLIFLTAKADLDMKLEGYQYGADDYLVKPFNIDELKAKARALITLRQMGKALQQAQEEKLAYVNQMAASLAHEIRNPLQPIRTYLEVLQDHYADPTFPQKMIEAVTPYLDRMDSLVQQLMHLGRFEKPSLSAMNPVNPLEDVLQILEPKLKSRRILVQKKFLKSPTSFLADPNQLAQVFFNLIKNALEAMPQGGTLLIQTEKIAENGKNLYQISFKDSGLGMDGETLQHLFEPFYTTKKEKGTGLGLSISKQIVEAHQGKIWAESKPGQGALFLVQLPMKEIT
ncbi:MAG: response regulator [Chlamydiae bacterium]|nr:response regulator [Chlamydiota bacterium]MBI3266580.1 response regulator [Chlamydiota bacterium]